MTAKQALVSWDVLVHYDPKLPITLACDASTYGIRAVIYHTFPDGSEHPIAFASHTLTSAERNYAQLENEGDPWINQFHYSYKFTLLTAKQLTVLGPKKGILALAAARLQRWVVLLHANLIVYQDYHFPKSLKKASSRSINLQHCTDREATHHFQPSSSSLWNWSNIIAVCVSRMATSHSGQFQTLQVQSWWIFCGNWLLTMWYQSHYSILTAKHYTPRMDRRVWQEVMSGGLTPTRWDLANISLPYLRIEAAHHMLPFILDLAVKNMAENPCGFCQSLPREDIIIVDAH